MNWTAIDEQDGSLLVVKDENKKIVTWPNPGDFDITKAIARLHRVNEHLSRTYIGLNVTDETMSDLANVGQKRID